MDKNKDQLYTSLIEAHKEYAETMVAPRLPVVFIIGAARTGTTLISQLLYESGAFSYISNITAKFPEAPAMGMLISKELTPLLGEDKAQYESNLGRTKSLQQPHEFGYFWNRWFDFGQETHNLNNSELSKIDNVGLLRELAAMESICNKPLVFKNNTWHSLQASFIATILPAAIFIVCRRKQVFTAQSHLLGREQQFGNREKWWSIRPSTYPILKELSLWEQLSGQVIDIEAEMDVELGKIPDAQIIDAPYEDICKNPKALVSKIYDAVKAQGMQINEALTIPSGFKVANTRKIPKDEWALLEQAIDKMSEGSRHTGISDLSES